MFSDDRAAIFLPERFPLRWASAWGEDEYGLWMRLELGEARQRFRWIAPGTFRMGSPADEPGRNGDEVPHEVTLSEGYWLADTACTQALWQAVTGRNPSRFREQPGQPVEQVSWNEVQDFLAELNRRLPGLEARLPSEAEWEYACRAGTTTPFSFAIRRSHRSIRKVHKLAATACCAAARGTTSAGSCVLPAAAGTCLAGSTTSSGSGSP